MGSFRNIHIVWDDLLDAFSSGDDTVYFLDRDTGEVFFVPTEYDDTEFWREVGTQLNRYLRIPQFDYEHERFLVYEFIRQIDNPGLKRLLMLTFTGNSTYGRLDDILSFYPEEEEQFVRMRDQAMSGRIKFWLEEHDLYPSAPGETF